MVTDGSGNVIARHDFLPFGDEIPANSMGRSSASLWNFTDNITQKFTGQERDETGLDYFDARFFSSSVGRFISPDPMSIGADLYNPQTWNGYAYVTNSPLSDVDPDGMQTASTGSTGESGGSAGSAGSNPWWSRNPFSGSWTWGGSRGIAGNFGRFYGSNQRGQIAQPSTLDQILARFPSIPQPGLDAIAAFGDTFSFGFTQLISPWTGGNIYNRNSTQYHTASGVFLVGSLLTGEGEAQIGARVTSAAERAVIGHIPGYSELAERLGARYFDIPANIWEKMTDAERWAANQKFRDRAIARGNEIILETAPSAARPGSVFARELQYLRERGFRPTPDGTRLIR